MHKAASLTILLALAASTLAQSSDSGYSHPHGHSGLAGHSGHSRMARPHASGAACHKGGAHGSAGAAGAHSVVTGTITVTATRSAATETAAAALQPSAPAYQPAADQPSAPQYAPPSVPTTLVTSAIPYSSTHTPAPEGNPPVAPAAAPAAASAPAPAPAPAPEAAPAAASAPASEAAPAAVPATAKTAGGVTEAMVLAAIPGSDSCSGAEFPNECITADVATPFIAQSLVTYGISSNAAQAAVLSLIAVETGLKYNTHHFPSPDATQGTRNMMSAKFVAQYATQLYGAAKVAAAGSPTAVLQLVNADEGASSGSAAWFLATQCPAVLTQFATDPEGAFTAYINCIGTSPSAARTQAWNNAKTVFGVA